MALVNLAVDAVVALISGLRMSPKEQEDSIPQPVQRRVTFAPVCEVIPEQQEYGFTVIPEGEEPEECCPFIDVEAMEAKAAADYARQGQSA